MEDRKITEKESLDLITQMIRNTQNKIEAGSGRPFLLFGYTSIAFAVAIWFLITTTGTWYWNYLWFLLPVICWPIAIRIYKKNKNKTTYIDRVVTNLWILSAVAIFIACSPTIIYPELESLFFTIIILGMATTLTGLILRIRTITTAGAITMLISPVMLWLEGADRILPFAAIFLLIFVIPGHILNNKSKNIA